jgi:hypothetical protein
LTVSYYGLVNKAPVTNPVACAVSIVPLNNHTLAAAVVVDGLIAIHLKAVPIATTAFDVSSANIIAPSPAAGITTDLSAVVTATVSTTFNVPIKSSYPAVAAPVKSEA